jgi:hypothetical protein
MSKKTVRITTRQRSSAAPQEAWVNNRKAAPEVEAVKRLTVDVPAALHRRIKVYCAANDLVMAEAVRAILEEKFPPM